MQTRESVMKKIILMCLLAFGFSQKEVVWALQWETARDAIFCYYTDENNQCGNVSSAVMNHKVSKIDILGYELGVSPDKNYYVCSVVSLKGKGMVQSRIVAIGY